MSIQLRDYQLDLIARARAALRTKRRLLIQAPTGSGKTALAAFILASAAAKGWLCFFIVHRRELIDQTAATFDKCGIQYGIIAAGYPERRCGVQICGVQTLTRRLDSIVRADLLIFDECTHIASRTWSDVAAAHPEAIHIGLTATPERLDGKGLDAHFDAMVLGPSVQWLMERGFLSRYRIFAPTKPAVDSVHVRGGDYATGELAQMMDKPLITGDAVTHYLKLCPGKRAIVSCVSIEHSLHVAANFRAAGFNAVHVDGGTAPEHRRLAMTNFRAGATLILTNVDLFGEGVDVPALEAAILLRPTMSRALYLQQVGRALRPCDGKEALILDHAGNCRVHGLPDDPVEWTLEGRERGQRVAESVESVRVCQKCFAANRAQAKICSNCGLVFAVVPREVATVDGELAEIDLQAARRAARTEQGEADSLEALKLIERQRGYKAGWANYVWRARTARRNAISASSTDLASIASPPA